MCIRDSFSDVGFPSGVYELETCQVCHQKAPQAANYATVPSRAACGACHDNVNFATGLNHVNLPQVDDNGCASCHIPKGELELDASIQGAHILPQESATAPGIVINLVKVDNGTAGKMPTITFTLKDKAGKPIDPSTLVTSPNKISFVLVGPTSVSYTHLTLPTILRV